MPGSTPLGIPYPYQGETVNATSWQNMATAIDGLMTSLDAIRDGIETIPTARIEGGSANAVASATTVTVTNYNLVSWDNAGYANLGAFPSQLTVPPGLYYVTASGTFASTTTTAMARIHIITGATIWAASMIDTSSTTGTTLSTATGLVLATTATTAIQSSVRWQGTGGPPNFTFCALEVMKIRALADV